jgi:hypothetical protein
MHFWQITLDHNVTGREETIKNKTKLWLINFFLIISTNVPSRIVGRTLYNEKKREMRYHQYVNFHIKGCMYILATLYGRPPIITHQMNSSLEFNHRTSIKHVDAFTLLFFPMIINGRWWCTIEIAWSVVTGHGPWLTNINCMCVNVWDPWRNWEESLRDMREKSNLVRVLIFGLYLYDLVVFLIP